MNFLKQSLKSIDRQVSVTEIPSGLSAISQTECAAVIWVRKLPSSIHQWLDGLASTRLPRINLTLPADAVNQEMQSAIQSVGGVDSIEMNFLIDDVTALASIFASIMNVQCLKLSLDSVEHQHRHNFHTHLETARLICTYSGLGTQCGIAKDGIEPEEIFAVPTGCPMIVRGAGWLEVPLSGFVYHSPPQTEPSYNRMVLILEPVTDAETMMTGKISHLH